MDLRSELLQEHSKSHTLYLAEWIGANEVRFDQLIFLLFHDEKLVGQRAAWVFTYCTEAFPELIQPHFKLLLEDHLPYGSAGLQNREKKVLKWINSMPKP